jgi:hypothetical protein
MFDSIDKTREATIMSEVSGLSASRIIGVSDQTIRRHVLANRLKARQEGLSATRWIDLDDLREFARRYNYRFNEELAQELARN